MDKIREHWREQMTKQFDTVCNYCGHITGVEGYTEEEYQELKDIIKTQEDYINKTLIRDSDLVEESIKQERRECYDL